MAAVGGVPLMQGVWSAGLHMPGAASLANTASQVARAWGVSQPVMGLMPSLSWRPMVRPRRRARSTSVKSPSGLRQSRSLSASLASSSGRCSELSRASWASAWVRVSRSTKQGSRCQNERITATCAGPSSPLRCAAAVAGSTGSSGSPFNARRSPRSVASCTRWEASARVIRSRSASTAGSLPPNTAGSTRASSLISPCSTAGS